MEMKAVVMNQRVEIGQKSNVESVRARRNLGFIYPNQTS